MAPTVHHARDNMEKKTCDANQDMVNANALRLASRIGQCIESMIGAPFALPGNDGIRSGTTFSGMVVIAPFSGTVQGYCVLALDESVAARLLATHLKTPSHEAGTDRRDEYVGFCQEVLNVAVGQSMGDFERDLGDLSYFTSIVVYGTIVFPPVLAASLTLATQCGEVRCAFMLDMSKPKIAQKLKVAVDDLSKKTIESITDGLTKVYNRSFFEERLRQEIEAARKTNKNLGLIMIDLDHFKQLNDTFGHVCGDDALRTVANALQSSIAATDIPGRYGGDEFIIALPGRNPEACAMMAERIRFSVKEAVAHCAAKKKHQSFLFSVSMGVTNLVTNDTFDEIVGRVDKLLYSAKRAGRNMFVCG
jgi:diguanylate cyclase (GGDEF)-like protein